MERLSINQYFLEMVVLVAARSTCIRRRVGAIITDEHGHVLSMGYNGVPVNFDHCIDHPCLGASDLPGNNNNCMAVHAEQNAIMQCADLNKADIMYCSCVPCFICAKMICNTKIRTIVAREEYSESRGLDVLLQGGIIVIVGDRTYGMEEDENNPS